MQPTLTIEQAVAIAAVLNGNTEKPVDPNTQIEKGDGRVVIVRSRDAGVLWGNYQGREGANIHLTNAVQMWSWRAAKGGTLVDCAIHGVSEKDCKFSTASATATVFNACALIDCSVDGAASLAKVDGGKWD
jgi:hypothetical protein